jgi:hypothetical protein
LDARQRRQVMLVRMPPEGRLDEGCHLRARLDV